MTRKQLNQHFKLLEKKEKTQELRAALFDAAGPGASKVTGMPHANTINDKVGNIAVEIADLDARIEYLQAEIKESERDILAFIAGIDDDRIRIALRLHYINGKPWKEVSSTLGKHISEDSVQSACYRYFKNRTEEQTNDY